MPPPDRPVLEDPEPVFRLVVADHHEATRTGIRLALGSRGFSVAAEAADADGAVGAVLREHPDECLIATGLPGGAIRAATEIHARAPEVAIVMLATVADDAELFAALEAGGRGYLPNDIEPAALGGALRGVMRGEAAIPRCLVARLVLEFRARSATGGHRHERSALDGLTVRQLVVLELLANGAGTAEIGRRMAISRTTVRRHTSELVARLGVDSRDAAIDAYPALRGQHDGTTHTDIPARGRRATGTASH